MDSLMFKNRGLRDRFLKVQGHFTPKKNKRGRSVLQSKHEVQNCTFSLLKIDSRMLYFSIKILASVSRFYRKDFIRQMITCFFLQPIKCPTYIFEIKWVPLSLDKFLVQQLQRVTCALKCNDFFIFYFFQYTNELQSFCICQ